MIRLENVTKIYGPVRALVGITCSFAEGAITVLRGPNGSGKSTLLSIVGTLARPTSGRVEHGPIAGNATSTSTRGRRNIRAAMGWVAHDSLCYPDLTGRQNIELAATLHGRDPTRAYEHAVERFDLRTFADRPVRTYSRGQRQRIALARALVHAPLLVLLDEPTTGLDPAATDRLRQVLRDEAARGATIVLSTHDRSFADDVAGAVVSLERGRLAPG
jgi:heme exporter protein A